MSMQRARYSPGRRMIRCIFPAAGIPEAPTGRTSFRKVGNMADFGQCALIAKIF